MYWKPTRQFETPFANLRVIAVGHPEDCVMDACHLSHLVHFLWGGMYIAILKIIKDSVVEQNSILGEES